MNTPNSTLRLQTPRRTAVRHRFLMCAPEHFDVTYAINTWMQPDRPTNRDVALRQWSALRRSLERLGHTVDLIEPVTGLPDMVFAANGALIHADRAVVSRFAHPERAHEAALYGAWLTAAGFEVHTPRHRFEGAGDVVMVPGHGLAIAGFGPRTDRRSHDEVARSLGLDVLSVELVDERYYHLDTALNALDERTALYVPEAFTDEGIALITDVFPTTFPMPPSEANRLAANAISDGHAVLMCDEAPTTAAWLRSEGFQPVPLPATELLKGGGGLRCCVLSLGATP